MEHPTNDSTLKARAFALIEAGKVTMRPRWHFLLRSALAAAGAVFLALALVYLFSFIVFALRESGAWYVTPFGLRGLHAFLTAMPWVLVAVALVVVALLELLVRRFAFSWKRPLLYSVLGILALVTVAGLAVARTPLHPRLKRHAEERRLPFGGGLYRGAGARGPSDVHPGLVVRLRADGFDLEEPRRGTLPVLVLPGTRFMPDGRLMAGEHVIVFGPMVDGRIRAVGVRQVPLPLIQR